MRNSILCISSLKIIETLTMSLKELRGQFCKSPPHVGPDALGRLVGDLDTVLKDTDWEVFGRHGAEEETVVLVDFVRFFRHVFDHVLHG